MKLYYLTDSCVDGRMLYSSRFMEEGQLEEEQQKCIDYSDGAFMWIEASPTAAALPRDELFYHIPSLSSAA